MDIESSHHEFRDVLGRNKRVSPIVRIPEDGRVRPLVSVVEDSSLLKYLVRVWVMPFACHQCRALTQSPSEWQIATIDLYRTACCGGNPQAILTSAYLFDNAQLLACIRVRTRAVWARISSYF